MSTSAMSGITLNCCTNSYIRMLVLASVPWVLLWVLPWVLPWVLLWVLPTAPASRM